jgi:hypothetical protein
MWFGQGKVGEKNVMQLLFAAFYLCDRFDIKEWRGMVKEAFNNMADNIVLQGNDDCEPIQELGEASDEYVNMLHKLPKPILTRWWTIGYVAGVVFELWKLILFLAQSISKMKSFHSDTATGKTASDLVAMMDSKNKDSAILHMQLAFIVGFHREFFNPHFEFLQGSD